MKTLLFLPLLLVAYLIYIRVRYGMTVSISATAKLHKQVWEKAFFSLSLWLGISIPFIVLGIEACEPDSVQVLWFFAGCGIALVGTAQVFWEGGMEHRMHMIGAYGGIGLGMVAVLVHLWSWSSVLLVGLFVLFALAQMLPLKSLQKWKIPNSTYWLEVAAIIVIEMALIIN